MNKKADKIVDKRNTLGMQIKYFDTIDSNLEKIITRK